VTREKGKNTAASIRARLLALAQNKGEDYQRVLGRYAIERFLYRRAGRHIGTNLPSREPHSLRCGPATLTGPQKIWIYSDKDHPLSAMSNKQSEESARFRKKTALYSTAHRSKAPKSKRMTSTMASASSSWPIWLERAFRCRSTSGLVMPCTRNPNWPRFLSSCTWKHLSFVHIRERPASLRNFRQ